MRTPQKTVAYAWLSTTQGPTDRAEATRGSAVVQAMMFDGADSCPTRLAAAGALVPAEEQGHEAPRGGRTQLDVDGTVSGHRL